MIDIVQYITQSGIPLRPRGSLFVCCCPFHKEKTPSFTVYSETQSFSCFGCGQSGDLIQFVMLYNNLSYREALKVLDIKDPAFNLNKLRTKLQPKENIGSIDQFYLQVNRVLLKLNLSISKEAVLVDENYCKENIDFLRNFLSQYRKNIQ